MVHPITKERVTKYRKITDNSLLRNNWMKAMYIELGRLTQGHKDTKVTETSKFMALDKIPNIPEDQTVKYAIIVVDY